jgi:Tol biopolymer transport system component
MNKLILLLILFINVNNLSSQTISVVETKKIIGAETGEFYFPKFSPDGTKIFITGKSYNGLYSFNLNDGTINKINDDAGAGYEFKISEDGNYICFRNDKFINGRKFSSLKYTDLRNGKTVTVENETRNLSVPLLVKDGKIIYALNDIIKQSEPGTNSPERTQSFVYSENSKIILVSGGTKKILTPLGEEGHYIWPALSPDKTKILFTYSGRGTFISDLDGKIISDLGYANSPVFSPDGKWILFMKDEDDGNKYTSSDIYIKSSDGSREFQLTNTENQIEMYPDWAPDGKRIVFHSDNGEIFIMNLRID